VGGEKVIGTSPRIAVAGNQWITEYLINALVANGVTPSLVINNDSADAPTISGYSDLGPLAAHHGIELYRPKAYSLKTDDDRAELTGREIDVLLVFGWQRLIPDWLIDHTTRGAWGVHGGPEKPPRCRGRAVFNWAILLGYQRFYLYLFKLTAEVDAGGIARLTEFEITPADDVLTLYHKNCIVSTRMMLDALPDILAGTVALEQQSAEGATYLPKRTPEMGGIYWDWDAKRIENLIRAVAPPYPGAFTTLDGAELKISRAHVFDDKIRYAAEPGTILERFPNGDLLVMAGDAPLYIREYAFGAVESLAPGVRFDVRSGRQPADPKV
jgi:methionyl-tRNA formyltransferase